MATETNLTACIVCSDYDPHKRTYKLVKLLVQTKKFSEIYTLISEEVRQKKFTTKNIDGTELGSGDLIHRDEIPVEVTLAFVHSSDIKNLWKPLWLDTERKANVVCYFTASDHLDIKEDGLIICRKSDKNGDLDITLADINEIVEYSRGKRTTRPSICFPAMEVSSVPEIITLIQRQHILENFFSLLKRSSLHKPSDYQTIYQVIGSPKPIIYVLDDYNNYVRFKDSIYSPNPYLTPEVADYYCGQERSSEFSSEILAGFCLMLNNLSLAFTVKAPPLWIPNTKAGYDLVSTALPLSQIEGDRPEIAAFIIDLEWLPTLTNYTSKSIATDRQQWRKMGCLCVDILSQIYPEIPSFIFTGLQPAEELQEVLSRGASWGFQKEKTHHYSREQRTPQQLTEQLTYINLERHLNRFVKIRYGAYQEVPFSNQLKLSSSTPAQKQLIKQLSLEESGDKGLHRQTLQKLIAALLPAATHVEPVKVLTTGKSKAQATFFVSPTSGQDKLATRFIKIGPWLSVQKEYLAYRKVIEPRLNSYTARLVHPPILVEGNSGEMPKGALMYSLAGFPENYKNLRSLNELLEQHLEKSGGDIFLGDRFQNTLEEVLLPLYQSTSSPMKKQPLWCWLGDVLPPLYTGTLVPLPLTSPEAFDEKSTTTFVLSSQTAQGYKDTSSWTLASFALTHLNSALEKQYLDCQQSGIQDPSHWDDEILHKPYQQILLLGWHLSAVDWKEGNLGSGSITLVHPDLGFKIVLRGRSEDIRLRFGPTWIRPGMTVKVLACLDTSNQELEKIKRKINANLSCIHDLTDAADDPSTDIFEYILNHFQKANQLSNLLISPFQVFEAQSLLPHHYTLAAHSGPIHGDLNLNNILYSASETVGWLIDFELVKEQGMMAFDLAKLEVEIWNHHLSPYLAVLATLSPFPHASSCYQLLCWSLQALDFPGDETEFFITKAKIFQEDANSSSPLFMPVINGLKVIKTIRNFGLKHCKLTHDELKWALASYFFNTIKFPSQSKRFNQFSDCSAIFSFIASAWHLDGVMPISKF